MNLNKKAFVIGWPVTQSKSPLLHGHWLNSLDLAGSYEKVPVPPGELNTFLSKLEQSGYVGGNVTVPHKEGAYAIVDECDEIASQLEAVNTVWLQDGKLMGTNTDGYGFAANLDDYTPLWRRGRKAIVLGAGGASRAIVWAIREAGYSSIHIINRTLARAEALAKHFGPKCHAHAWEEINDQYAGCDLLVNTTSLTMNANEPLPFTLDGLPRDAIVTDIVYTPLETSLLKMASKGNWTCVDGLGMLLHQAVPGFEKWFGHRPNVTPQLRAHILKHLNHGE